MKKILFAFLCFISSILNAQLDTEHWFAPMSARAGISNLQSYLYLSTNEITPFSVQISNNNTVFATVQISKGAPARVNIPDIYMMATSQADLFSPTTMGITAKGSKKFFANYRFSVSNHAEIMTSKGLAGVGKTFYAGVVPLTGAAPYVNSSISVLATEDNTQVTLSGHNPNVLFSNGVSTPTLNFTLNKGQSYIIDAISSDSSINLDGLVGAKITATKPVSVTNGNFNGIYTQNNFTNNDILMDQAVPTERLGNEFVMVKGNGNILSGMESALIIATEDNTTISFNGNATAITLNEGEYYIVPSTNYIDQGSGNYNMHIKANKNIYVYQLLAGVSSSSPYATGGMNYIPPLSCFLPNKVDEIGYIDEIGFNSYNLKLNIITETGANILVNNTPPPSGSGPYPVTGNPNWVTYSIPDIYGNISISSTKAVTAGIAGGSGAVGYGGYFAGFSSVPAISKTGDCYNGITLQVDNTYDSYQWYLDGNVLPGATIYFINPELYGAGNYTCLVTKNNCESKLTLEYNYMMCPPIKVDQYTIGSCNTISIQPQFSTPGSAPVNNLTQIIVQPTQGSVTINPTTGLIQYTPNAALTNTVADTFVYYISDNNDPAKFEYVRAEININVIQVQTAMSTTCSNQNGQGIFDLTTISVTNDIGTTVAFYSDSALTTPINNPTNYTSYTSVVYAEVSSPFNCKKVATIQLIVNPAPHINRNISISLCDDDFDGDLDIDFSNITSQILLTTGNFNVRYYTTNADALAGNNNNLPTFYSVTTNTTFYVRVDDNANLCPPAIGSFQINFGTRTTLLTQQSVQSLCDNDRNGEEIVNLLSYISTFSTNPAHTYTFHNSLQDAQNGANPINTTITQTAIAYTYYIRISSPTSCANVVLLTINLKTPNASLSLQDTEICPGQTTILDAGIGFDSYLWNTGATTQSITAGPGNYFVYLESNGCTYKEEVIVTAYEQPTITGIETSGTGATIHVSGGISPYTYSLNGIDYQTSNTFTSLPRGVHTIYVMGADQCMAVSKEFLILNLVNAITPNGDGINETLNYTDLALKKDVSIEIVNRYGAPVYKSAKNNSLVWDGKLNGTPVPTGTYWYTIRWIEPDTQIAMTHSGWLLVKNRN